MTLVVRTETDIVPQLGAIRARLQAVDPRQPLYGLSTMAALIETSTAERRFSLLLMTVFAGLTLILSALGLYGVLTQRVAERTREIGVRLALGARPSQVFGLVMGEGVALVAVGVTLGFGLVVAGVPLIDEFVFGVSVSDAVTYLTIVLVLAVTTLVATALPSRAAARTDPVTVIKG
jgi:ABC-type antimicrobial peptide transport system permease subunit